MSRAIVKIAQTVESATANAMAAVDALVTGWKQSRKCSRHVQSTGQAFIKMAAEIIAKQLVMIAPNQFSRLSVEDLAAELHLFPAAPTATCPWLGLASLAAE